MVQLPLRNRGFWNQDNLPSERSVFNGGFAVSELHAHCFFSPWGTMFWQILPPAESVGRESKASSFAADILQYCDLMACCRNNGALSPKFKPIVRYRISLGSQHTETEPPPTIAALSRVQEVACTPWHREPTSKTPAEMPTFV